LSAVVPVNGAIDLAGSTVLISLDSYVRIIAGKTVSRPSASSFGIWDFMIAG
jgi:hypothetical protein